MITKDDLTGQIDLREYIHGLALNPWSEGIFSDLRSTLSSIHPGFHPIRFSVVDKQKEEAICEIGFAKDSLYSERGNESDIFDFQKVIRPSDDRFSAVLIIPTGIGAELGGHAGDAGPAAMLLSACCDRLITHPNVVNASDLNELPTNGLYVEGSVLTRLLMGNIGLSPVRANKVGVFVDYHAEESFNHLVINATNAAVASYGLNCPKIKIISPPTQLFSTYNVSGRATGYAKNLNSLVNSIREVKDEIDAIAISSSIYIPLELQAKYYQNTENIVNPWGGIEAMLTHFISDVFCLPAAHAPMFLSLEEAGINLGLVDPRLAAEAISLTFFQSVLKGLQRSPKIINDPKFSHSFGVITAADIDAVIIPDGCLGLPMMAAYQQGIPLIVVRGNRTILGFSICDWEGNDNIICVENYLEAAGVLTALRKGISLNSLKRPLLPTVVSN